MQPVPPNELDRYCNLLLIYQQAELCQYFRYTAASDEYATCIFFEECCPLLRRHLHDFYFFNTYHSAGTFSNNVNMHKSVLKVKEKKTAIPVVGRNIAQHIKEGLVCRAYVFMLLRYGWRLSGCPPHYFCCFFSSAFKSLQARCWWACSAANGCSGYREDY